MGDGVGGALGPRPARVGSLTPDIDAPNHDAVVQPELTTVEHPRRFPLRFMSRLVTMTLIGASILLTAGAVLGANHAPANGGPLTEEPARSSVDSARYVNTRPLVKVLVEAKERLSEVEFERRSAEETIRWHRKLLEQVDAGEAGADRRPEAEMVIARETEKLRGMSRELAAAKARVAEAEHALAPSIKEATTSLAARGLPIGVRDEAPHRLIDAAAIAEAWVNRNGALPVRVDAIYWLLHGGDTDAILTSLAEHPRPLFSDPMELTAAGPLDPIGWRRAETLRDRFDYHPDARDLADLGHVDGATFDRLLSLFGELDTKAHFSLTDDVRRATFGAGWSRTDLTTMLELVATDESGRHGFWLDAPSNMFAQRPVFELSAFVEAAKLFSERTGLPFTAEHAALTSLLGSDLAPERDAVSFLLDQVSLTGARGETEQLALAARRGGPDGRAMNETSFAIIRKASSRLGRKLTVGEASAIVSAKLPIDALLPPAAVEAALAVDPNASLQDIALFAKTGAADPKALLERIEQKLTPGVSRRDRAAEYSESWAGAKSVLTKGDLVRVDLLLDYFRSREGRRAVGRAVALDLAEPNSEAGGRIELAGGKPALTLVASESGNNNSYVYPDTETPLLFALVPFHLHAIAADGNPYSAGPSSAYGGTTGDRAASRNRGIAEVVITHLDRDRFGVDYYTPSGAVVDLGTFAYSK